MYGPHYVDWPVSFGSFPLFCLLFFCISFLSPKFHSTKLKSVFRSKLNYFVNWMPSPPGSYRWHRSNTNLCLIHQVQVEGWLYSIDDEVFVVGTVNSIYSILTFNDRIVEIYQIQLKRGLESDCRRRKWLSIGWRSISLSADTIKECW